MKGDNMKIMRGSKERVLNALAMAQIAMLALVVGLYVWMLDYQQYAYKRLFVGVPVASSDSDSDTSQPQKKAGPFQAQEGQSLVEYALIVAVIAIVVIAIMVIFGQNIVKIFTKANSTMCSDSAAC